MKTRTRNLIPAAIITLAVAVGIGLVVPRDTLNRLLGSLTGAANGTDGEYQLVVKLQYDSGRSYEYRAALSRSDAQQADMRPEAFRQEYVTRAKKALADSQGYGRAFGGDNHKIMSNVQVSSMKLTESSSGRSSDLWSAVQRGDSTPVMD